MIGSRIKQFRKQKGWTQRVLADRLNIPRSTLSEYEAGDVMPPADFATKMIKNTSIDAHWLLTGAEPQTCTLCMNEDEKDWCRKLIDIFREKEDDAEEIKMHINTILKKDTVKKTVRSTSSEAERKKGNQE